MSVPFDARVCPECGEPAGAQPFCAGCGVNLSQQPRLPSRAEWEREHAPSSDPATPQQPAADETAPASLEKPERPGPPPSQPAGIPTSPRAASPGAPGAPIFEPEPDRDFAG